MNRIVSIVVPVYNIEDYIDECIRSICSQTYKNIEIILVDDGSLDSSGQICDKWAQKDRRITVIHQKNQGVVMARANGINHSTGDWLMFVDGDDWIDSNMVEYMVDNVGDADMISTGVYAEQNDGRESIMCDLYDEGMYCNQERMNIILSKMIYDEKINIFHPMTPWIYNKLYRRQTAALVHSKVDSNIRFAEDTAFLYLYILECRGIAISHKCFYHYRYREGSAIHRANPYILDDISRFYNLLRPVFEKLSPEFDLIFQLEKWVATRLCLCINVLMGLSERVKVPMFTFVTNEFLGKSVVLYGAGKVGYDYYNYLKLCDANIVAWLDKNYINISNVDFPISSPDTIKSLTYDFVIICIEDADLKNSIKKYLLDMGVREEKIYWSKPYKNF